MINLTDSQLRQLQLIELDMLVEFDRICRKYDIKYSITGGTLLGAIRHGGFIPWDDDADVSMLREEYEKFIDVCDMELDDKKYYFQDIDRTPGYRWGYGKLRRKDTVFLREYQEHMPYEQGIFLDIFPRDGVPDGVIEGSVHKFCCFCVRKILWSAVGRYAAKNSVCRCWYSVLYNISLPWIKKVYYYLVMWSDRKVTKLVRALTFPVPHNEKGYRREWYNDYVDIKFEGYTLMAEKGYMNWIEQEFHDYMKLPPAEKRKVHPVVAIKFPTEESRDF